MVRELLCNFKDYMSAWFYNKETMDSKLAEKSDVTHTHDNISVDDLMNYIDTNCTLSIDENGELIFTDENLT